MKLSQGKTYEADIALSGLAKSFGSAGAVASKFQSLGFVGVTVTDLGDGKYHGRATWMQGDKDVPLPSEVSNVREVKADDYGRFGDPMAFALPKPSPTPARGGGGGSALVLALVAAAVLANK